MKDTLLDTINDEFQDFQDDLMTREKKLRLLHTFNSDIDDLMTLLKQPSNIDFTPKE